MTQQGRTVPATQAAACHYKQVTGQSIVDDTLSPINFDTVLYDSDNAVTTPDTNWTWTAPVSGIFLISYNFAILLGSGNTLTDAYLQVQVNGANAGPQPKLGTPGAVGAADYKMGCVYSHPLRLNRGDAVQLCVYQKQGANSNLGTSAYYAFIGKIG